MGPKQKYRVALIGCGDIAENGHVPALLKHPRFELVAVCDVRLDRAQFLSAKAGGIPVYDNYRQLLHHRDVDAAILALHPEVSGDVAIEFLKEGKPVLDEKPLSATFQQGQRLAQHVNDTKGIYQIGFVMRYSKIVKKIAEVAHRIGTPALYQISVFDEHLDRKNRSHFERIQHALKKSSAMTHEGSHAIDFFQQWNASPLVSVHAEAFQTENDFLGPNVWSAQFHVADESVLELKVGWLLPELPPCTVTITGPKGFLEIDLKTGKGTYKFKGITRVIRTNPITQDWRSQLDIFARAIDQGNATTSTVMDGLRTLAATMGCEQSFRTHQRVQIGLF